MLVPALNVFISQSFSKQKTFLVFLMLLKLRGIVFGWYNDLLLIYLLLL